LAFAIDEEDGDYFMAVDEFIHANLGLAARVIQEDSSFCSTDAHDTTLFGNRACHKSDVEISVVALFEVHFFLVPFQAVVDRIKQFEITIEICNEDARGLAVADAGHHVFAYAGLARHAVRFLGGLIDEHWFFVFI
jgi:hypothetical protein